MNAQADQITLRSAVAGDVPVMAQVLHEAWQGGYRGVLDDAVVDASHAADWESALQQPGPEGTRSVVATDPATQVVGFVRFGPDPDDGGGSGGYIASVYVSPRTAGHGVGRQLVQHAVAELTSAGYDTVRLWVFSENTRARALYERCGFSPDGMTMTDPRWGALQVRYRYPSASGPRRP